MPYGCGTWPAFWTFGPDWPQGGEVDVLEGVNTNDYNWATLHTGGKCTIAGANETGALQTNNCDEGGSSTGCVVQDSRSLSYGSGLNQNGGGVYVMQWTSDFIRVWFFPHAATPASIVDNMPNPAVDFGKPMANFEGSCNIDRHFRDHHAVIDLTFCGDWAGNVFATGGDGCPASTKGDSMASCMDFVAHNPRAFKEAYWDINYLNVFQTTSSSSHTVTPTPKITHSVSPAASSRSITSQSVGMGASKPPESSRLVPGSSVRPSSEHVTVSKHSSGRPPSSTAACNAPSTSGGPPSHSASHTSKKPYLPTHTDQPSGNTHRIIPTPSSSSLAKPKCGKLFAPPPLAPTISPLSSSPSPIGSPSSSPISSTLSSTTTLTHAPTSNPDALSAITFAVHCNSELTGIPITEVLTLAIREPHSIGRWGTDDAFVACMQKCAALSPARCVGVGFNNQTNDGNATCRIHGRVSAHVGHTASGNLTMRLGGNGTDLRNGSANGTYRYRLSRKLGRLPMHERRKEPAETLVVRHKEGNFAAVRAETSSSLPHSSSATASATAATTEMSILQSTTSLSTHVITLTAGSTALRVSPAGAGGVGSGRATAPAQTSTVTTTRFVTVASPLAESSLTPSLERTETRTLTRFVTVTGAAPGRCSS